MRAWWHAIGSDERFKPRSWFHKSLERAAYVEGLRDANRIIEQKRMKHWHDINRDPVACMRECAEAIHARSVEFAPELNK